MTDNRSTWEYDSAPDTAWWDDSKIEVTVTPTHVHIAVTEEQAVDSYNQEFTCSVKIPADKARDLARLLQPLLLTEPPESEEDRDAYHF